MLNSKKCDNRMTDSLDKRPYYNELISTDWMGEKFGMIFIVEYLHGDYPENIRPIGERRFYIHPDSLSLLAPIADDIGIDGELECFRYFLGQWCSCHPEYGDIAYGKDSKRDFKKLRENMRIIYRNGIPFIWPEIGP